MSKNLLLPTNFEKAVQRFFEKHKNSLLDVILFGSYVRGKSRPADIDILLLFKEKKDIMLTQQFRHSCPFPHLELEVIPKTYDELLSSDFLAREGILSEGYSIVKKEYISKLFNFSPLVLFRYDLKKLNKSKRMLFYYSLYGRKKGESGMLGTLQATKLTDSTLWVPVAKSEEAKTYLASWHIDFMEIPLLIPQRIVQSEKFRQQNRKD